jgi:hypothetical protein
MISVCGVCVVRCADAPTAVRPRVGVPQALLAEFSTVEVTSRNVFSVVRALLVRTRWQVLNECDVTVERGERDAVGRTSDASVSASWNRICVILKAAQRTAHGTGVLLLLLLSLHVLAPADDSTACHCRSWCPP